MALAGSNRKPALIAAASKISYSRSSVQKLKEAPWQDRAWQVYEAEGSIYFMTRYRSAIARKIDYFAALAVDSGDDPDADLIYNADGEVTGMGDAAKVLEAEGGPELLRRIVSELMVHWDVPGEGYLCRFDEEPFWRVLSTQELKKSGNTYEWLSDEGGAARGGIDPDGVYRVWKPHPRFHWQADSPTKHVLEDAEELILLRRELKARSQSRLPAGAWVLPDSVDFTPFGQDQDGTEDDFARELTNHMSQAVADAGSAAAQVPWILTVPPQDHALVVGGFMNFHREWDVPMEQREALLRSIATGLDVPPEILTGMADLNHWSAWLVSEQAVSQHVAPTVDDILDSLTVNWFRPLLEAASVDPDRYVLWRDLSPATVPPDRTDTALAMFKEGVISDVAVRRVSDFDEEDAPEQVEGEVAAMDADELLKRINAFGTLRRAGAEWEDAVRAVGLPPITQIPGLLPITVRAEEVVKNEEAVVSALTDLQEGGSPLPDAAVVAAVRRRVAATELADIDAELLAWVVAESETEILRLLDQAGLTSATDPIEESWLDRFRSRLDRKVAEAQAAARSWVEGLTGQPMRSEDESELRNLGIQVIIGGIVEAIRRRLFTPKATPDPIDVGRIPDILAPTDAIRDGLSRAGGGPAIYEQGRTSELVANGAAVHDELERNGFRQELMVWRTGTPSHPFDPHQRLEGVEFDSWDSPKLSITLDGQWISGTNYRPGDHRGCQCSVEQVLFESELRGVSPERSEELRKAREAFQNEPREAPTPLPRRERSETFRQAGQRLVEAAPKKHQQLFTEAMESVEQTLAELPIPVQARFIDMMDRMEKFKVTTVSGWRGGLVQGQFGTVGRTMPGRYPELLMETRRFDEDWLRWHIKQEGPEPSQWRTARPDEIASTLVHELTHAHDYWDKIDAVVEQRAMPLRRAFWSESRMDVRFKLLSGGNPEYAYGATEASEGLAEATRMYVYGEEGRPTATGFIGKTTGAEWRSLNPEMARFVEQVIWGME